jgi:hypothetical protein
MAVRNCATSLTIGPVAVSGVLGPCSTSCSAPLASICFSRAASVEAASVSLPSDFSRRRYSSRSTGQPIFSDSQPPSDAAAFWNSPTAAVAPATTARGAVTTLRPTARTASPGVTAGLLADRSGGRLSRPSSDGPPAAGGTSPAAGGVGEAPDSTEP